MFTGLFDFLQDFGNYEERAIDRFEGNELLVDTCRVSDSTQPFETAVAHPTYNKGKIVIVEQYDTVEDAQAGHDKWVDLMTNNPPTVLHDVSTACAAQICRELGNLPPAERGLSRL